MYSVVFFLGSYLVLELNSVSNLKIKPRSVNDWVNKRNVSALNLGHSNTLNLNQMFYIYIYATFTLNFVKIVIESSSKVNNVNRNEKQYTSNDHRWKQTSHSNRVLIAAWWGSFRFRKGKWNFSFFLLQILE